VLEWRAVGRIFLSPPDMSGRERELLLAAFDSNWVAPVGPELAAFEEDLADLVGVPHAVALSSGTAGLHLALLVIGIGPGDDVVVPSLTFAATANAVTYVGATPRFLDREDATWNLDPDLLADELADAERAGRLPKAVITVDLYGQCADYDRIVELCDRYGVIVLEDAAEALGATYRDRPAGSFGRAAVFSFNGNKIITTSGGGMLVSDDHALVERVRHLATQAREPAPHYEHRDIGFNYRLSNLLAALGRGQLEQLAAKVDHRRAVKARYREALADLDGIAFMPDAPKGRPSNWLTVVTLDPDEARATPEAVRLHLEAADIEARPAWKPMHLQPVFADAPMRGGAVAERIFATGLCLPSGSSLTPAEQDRVIDAIREVLAP
jgi:dTDP-4-amino-4,6-dideoxygalactose transaminase